VKKQRVKNTYQCSKGKIANESSANIIMKISCYTVSCSLDVTKLRYYLT